MDKFIQMDIFFFITSVIGFVVLFFAVLIGIYVFLITKRIHALTKSFQEFVTHVSKKGSEASDILSEKFESLIKETGIIQKVAKSLFAVLISKIIHGTIKKDARKKKNTEN
jgi:hypothetical protein